MHVARSDSVPSSLQRRPAAAGTHEHAHSTALLRKTRCGLVPDPVPLCVCVCVHRRTPGQVHAVRAPAGRGGAGGLRRSEAGAASRAGWLRCRRGHSDRNMLTPPGPAGALQDKKTGRRVQLDKSSSLALGKDAMVKASRSELATFIELAAETAGPGGDGPAGDGPAGDGPAAAGTTVSLFTAPQGVVRGEWTVQFDSAATADHWLGLLRAAAAVHGAAPPVARLSTPGALGPAPGLHFPQFGPPPTGAPPTGPPPMPAPTMGGGSPPPAPPPAGSVATPAAAAAAGTEGPAPLGEIFGSYDVDGSGEMSIGEIQAFMSDNSFDTSEAYAQSMIDLFDQVRTRSLGRTPMQRTAAQHTPGCTPLPLVPALARPGLRAHAASSRRRRRCAGAQERDPRAGRLRSDGVLPLQGRPEAARKPDRRTVPPAVRPAASCPASPRRSTPSPAAASPRAASWAAAGCVRTRRHRADASAVDGAAPSAGRRQPGRHANGACAHGAVGAGQQAGQQAGRCHAADGPGRSVGQAQPLEDGGGTESIGGPAAGVAARTEAA